MTVTMPLWALAVSLLASAGSAGIATHLVHRRRRFWTWLTWREQQAQTDSRRHRTGVARAIASVGCAPVAAEPAPIQAEAMVIAGTNLPARDTGLPSVAGNPYRTSVLAVIDAAYDVESTPDEADLPRDETRVTALGRRDDDTGTGPAITATVGPVHRYAWPTEAAPRPPWRAPVRMLHTAVVLTGRRIVGRWQPTSRWETWCDRQRVRILATTTRLAEAYRRTGRHADRVLHTRSWSEIAPERSRQWAADAAERARQAHRLILRAQAGIVRRPSRTATVAVPPMIGCTP